MSKATISSPNFQAKKWIYQNSPKPLHDDEYEELKESKLGVFIKFQELGFDWASRLIHYMRGFQLDIKKKYELWSLVGPEPVRFSLLEFENLTGVNCEYIEDFERPHCVVSKELTSLWEMLGVHVEAGPSTQEIIAALERCEGWSRDDRKRLAYLAIFTGYIEGRKYSTPTRVSLARIVMELERFENYPWGRVAFKVLMDSVKGRDISGCYTINGFAQALQVWVYTALPELGANYGNPLPNNLSPPILAYKSRKGRRQFKEAILTKKKVVKEDIPRPRKKARKEASEEAIEEAAAVASEEVAAEASEEVHTTVGGLTKEDIKTMFKDIVDAMREGFGTRLTNKSPGTTPSFCQSNKVWGTDIDDVYAPVNYNDTHWIAMLISIIKRHIVVWDNICSSISPEDLDVVMELFLYMVPYLLVECASSDEQRAQYSLEPFTYERPTNIPPARAGDCGVYTLKYIECHALGIEFNKKDFVKDCGVYTLMYIECHALGIEFSKKDFAKAKGKTMRDKMAVDIFQELPDAHEFENKDNDANLGAYGG
uniref:Ubiquitin-like protease family profile domain-containing protein n=1 Tax=Brassica oleracea var. oleracea TaxID=109376 RepID=A0A0D3BJM7_BRAOL